MAHNTTANTRDQILDRIDALCEAQSQLVSAESPNAQQKEAARKLVRLAALAALRGRCGASEAVLVNVASFVLTPAEIRAEWRSGAEAGALPGADGTGGVDGGCIVNDERSHPNVGNKSQKGSFIP